METVRDHITWSELFEEFVEWKIECKTSSNKQWPVCMFADANGSTQDLAWLSVAADTLHHVERDRSHEFYMAVDGPNIRI